MEAEIVQVAEEYSLNMKRRRKIYIYWRFFMELLRASFVTTGYLATSTSSGYPNIPFSDIRNVFCSNRITFVNGLTLFLE
jgi:hypothetical protein